MRIIHSDKNRKKLVLYLSILIIAVSSLALLASVVHAQPYLETVKHRNLTIDLGNGTKTNAQLTIPAVGNGPFPGVLLIHGSGANDKNETLGFVHKSGPKPITPFWQIAQYLSERGFAVLRYDKRGIGSNNTILDKNVWGNATINDFIHDADKALSVLLQQPEVNATKKATLIGHGEGTIIVPRVAVDNPDKVKTIVLIGAVAQNVLDLQYYQEVMAPLLYAEKVLDKDHQGMLSVEKASADHMFQRVMSQASGTDLAHVLSFIKSNATETQNLTAQPQSTPSKANSSTISIEKNLKPALVASFKNHTEFAPSRFSAKCLNLFGCPAWFRSHAALDSTLSMIGNVSSDISILIQQGKNDSQVPLEQGLLLQQRLTEVNHPDHLLIAYPDLGHAFSPSNEWVTSFGPMPQYVLQNMYEWLTSPAREVR